MTPRLGHFLARNWPLLMHCQWRVWHPPSQEECLIGSWHVSRRMTARVTITGQNMGKALCTTRHENAGIELTDVHSCCIITSVMVRYVWATLPESLVWLMTSSSAYTDRKCMEVMVVFIHPLVRPGCKNVLKRESWGGALILLDLKQSSAGAALTYKSLLEKMASHDAGDDVQLRHLTTERCCLTHSEGSVLTDGQPRAQWQRDIRWLSCGRIVSREFRVMTSLSFKSLSFICPPTPTPGFVLFVLQRAGGSIFSLATLYCTRHGGVSALGLTHAKPTNHFGGASAVFEGQFLDPRFLVFDILHFQREREGLQCGTFMPSGQIWQVCPFYLRSLRAPGAPRIHSHRQTTCEHSLAL